MDLHGLRVDEAKRVVRKALENVTKKLNEERYFSPNMGDGKNHIFKIICGAGKHSKVNEGDRLKDLIPPYVIKVLKY